MSYNQHHTSHSNGFTPYQSRLEASASLPSVVNTAAQGHKTSKAESSSKSILQLGAQMNALRLGPHPVTNGNASNSSIQQGDTRSVTANHITSKNSSNTTHLATTPGAFLTPGALLKLASADPRIRMSAASNEMDALYAKRAIHSNSDESGSSSETIMSAWARLIRQAAAGGMFEKRLEALERARMICVVCRETEGLKQCAKCHCVCKCSCHSSLVVDGGYGVDSSARHPAVVCIAV